MALSKDDQERVREYLLGRLSDGEQQKIEERLMTDDDFFEELEISKDEVIEDYCAGQLKPAEREWLEHHLLASAEGRSRRRFAQALGRLKPPPKPATLFGRLQALRMNQPWAMAAIASATAVVVIAVLVGKSSLIFKPTVGKTSLALTLISSSPTRGGESPSIPKVSLSPKVDELSITLVLPKSSSAGAGSRAELEDATKSRPVGLAQSDSKSVLVKIPAEQLQRGQYVLKLFTKDADGVEQPVPIRFFFNIE